MSADKIRELEQTIADRDRYINELERECKLGDEREDQVSRLQAERDEAIRLLKQTREFHLPASFSMDRATLIARIDVAKP